MKKTVFYLCFCYLLGIFCPFMANAQANIDSLEQKLLAHKSLDTTRVYLLVNLSKAYLQYATKVDTARQYMEQAIKLAKELNTILPLGYALDARGVYERSIAHYHKAIYYHKEALIIAEKQKSIELLILANNNIGVAYRRMGDDALALDYHLKALELSKSINNENNITYSLNGLGNLYYHAKEYNKALLHFKEACLLDKKNNNLLGIAINYNNIGGIFEKKGDYDSALFYVNESLKINEKIKNLKGIAICDDNLGVIYRIRQDYDKSLKYLKKALQVANASKDKIYVAQIYMHIGEVYIDINKPKKAIYYLTESIDIAEKIKARAVVQESYEYLSKAHQQKEEYQLALEYYRKAMKLKDALMNDEKTKQMAYLQAKFENEQKDTQIKVLKQASELHNAELFVQQIIRITLIIILIAAAGLVTMLYYKNRDKLRKNKQLQTQQRDLIQQKNEIQQQKDELDRVNLVKDRLFSIIGHDLRSPFNTIKGFIAIMKIGGLTEEEIKNITATIEQQLNQTLNLLNNLLYWSWSQMQGITANYEDFFINTIIENNIALLDNNAIKKHICIKNTLDKRLKIRADSNMVDTVVRNLLANAIKFTFHKGEVLVSYQDNTDHYVFCIADTGVGMTETQLQNLFGVKANSTFGTAHEKGTGLGLQICKEFLEKNNGEIWVQSELNKGSKFFFTLPKAM